MTLRHEGFAQLNGQRYLRWDLDHLPAAALVHDNAIDVVRLLRAEQAQQESPEADWQLIYRSGGVCTHRLRVPGGWIVKHASDQGLTSTYVPDTRHQWTTKILSQ
jgi:hypothetical protein